MASNNFFDQKDFTEHYDSSDIQNNKIIAAIGYIPVLFLVPLLAAPQSPFAKFHTNQGLIITLTFAACVIADKVLGTIFGFLPLLRHFMPDIISTVIWLAFLAFMIVGIVNAAQGKAKKLPIIGDIITIIS